MPTSGQPGRDNRPAVAGESTVKAHIDHVFVEIEVRDRAQAVACAFRNGVAVWRIIASN
jgi:hypothetical protein